MRNPLHAKDMFIKFAHSQSMAAQHPDLIQKIDQMIEDAAWSVEFSKRVFKEAGKMRSTYHNHHGNINNQQKVKVFNLSSMYNSKSSGVGKNLKRPSFRMINQVHG